MNRGNIACYENIKMIFGLNFLKIFWDKVFFQKKIKRDFFQIFLLWKKHEEKSQFKFFEKKSLKNSWT